MIDTEVDITTEVDLESSLACENPSKLCSNEAEWKIKWVCNSCGNVSILVCDYDAKWAAKIAETNYYFICAICDTGYNRSRTVKFIKI